LKNNKEEYRGS